MPAVFERSAAIAVLALALVAAGCATPMKPTAFSDGRPEMRPESFFGGRTESTGMLETASGAPLARFKVVGRGRRLADGRFQLDQVVSMQGRAGRSRTWIMSVVDDHHYLATLTDASGPVHADAYGDLFHLRYAMKGSPLMSMEQWLYLQPDGRTVLNEAVVRLAGVPIRHLSESISAVDR